MTRFKEFIRHQQGIISKYEAALATLQRKSKAKLKEQEIKNEIYKSFVTTSCDNYTS